MNTLRLKKREERRLLAGHGWVFSNEVDIAQTPLKGLEPGSAVRIESANGRFLAHAHVNPHSLIAARVTSRVVRHPFSATRLRHRLEQALALRSAHYREPYYRLVHGEGDFLPGLVVDRYGPVLVVQITTAGMEGYRHEIVDALQSLTGATAIYLRNDGAMRELEKLPSYREWAVGEPVECLQIIENDLHFEVPAELGQKTGWFYDHRESRAALRSWVSGKRVLDVYTYLGSFALNAAAAGASEVWAVDASQMAIDAANANAQRNGLQDQVTMICDDAVEALRSLFEAGERFDVVVLDPPAFIKRRRDREQGLRHYALNNRLAMRLLHPGGILFSASCSQALSHEDLQQQLRQNVPRDRVGLQLLGSLRQSADHPVHAAMPETLYLSGIIARLP